MGPSWDGRLNFIFARWPGDNGLIDRRGVAWPQAHPKETRAAKGAATKAKKNDRAPPSSISSNKARHDSDGNHDKKPPAKKTTTNSSKKQAPCASFPSTSDNAPVTPVAPDDVGNEPAHSEEKKAKEVDPSGGEEQNDMTETDKAFFRS
ncbi:expressed unknown protein [Seminavis robusta]|uniref:Uncharacterized protein n=1 Tax=Seminavis robusta TaxID=568900 RepID=A0A9N8F1S2_9STRA|nr:expressed unknown protein [Seminavis robusta]|eukprot:Sro2852_g338620.1 n/a (149) ;mRNA; f:7283-7910